MNLAEWLTQRGLDRLEPLLRQAGIDLDVLQDLENSDLEAIGLSLGDRKRLRKAVIASPPDAQDATNQVDVRGPARAASGAAERRQLTVMFCDLVGSTVLSSRLDPEDLRHVIDVYHRAIATAVAPYEGHIAQLLGDGALVYFGYPRAHEDDADRAARAAIAVQGVVAQLRPHGDLQLQARIGVASGQVVVGEVGAGTTAAELSASGETPNLAARLQGCAEPGEILVSMDTRRLLGAAFELQSMGSLDLKGFGVAIPAWKVLGERVVDSRFEALHTNELTDFVGRESEVSMLVDRWSRALDGEGQVVLMSGEAGIGKSRISQTLRQRLGQAAFEIVLWQCSPYFASSALFPVVQQLERAAKIEAIDTPDVRSAKFLNWFGHAEIDGNSLGYFLKLIGLPDEGRIPSLQLPQQVKANTLKALVDRVHSLGKRQPVLLLVEDAHWIDPTTEELLTLAIEGLRRSRVLVLVTCRPEYAPSWGNPTQLTRLQLSRLGQRNCAALVNSVAGAKTLPADVIEQIVAKTDGIPLFVEELTKTVIESGLLAETPTGYELRGPLPQLAIPSTLQDSLMSRLDRLAPAKEVAQVGAVIGREFSHRLLAAVLGQMPEASLSVAIEELVRSELVFRSGTAPTALYTFKHALVRDTAYGSMVKAQRALRHGQIARAIERVEPDTVIVQPELLAHHHQEAGDVTTAFNYWIRAGDLAAERQAIREAVKHYQAALELFARLDGVQRTATAELDLQMKLGAVLMNSEGYRSPATHSALSRALELAKELGDVARYVTAFAAGTPTMYSVGQFADVLAAMQRIRPEALVNVDARVRFEHLVSTGIPQFHLGRYIDAWRALDAARRISDTASDLQGHMMGGGASRVSTRGYAARVRAYSGYLDDAKELTDSARSIADQMGHAPTTAWAYHLAAITAILKGDMAEAARLARIVIDIGERIGIPMRVGIGMMHLGQVLLATGKIDEATVQIRKGYETWSTIGGRFHCSEYAVRAADGFLAAGCVAQAAEFVAVGEQVQRDCEERLAEAELIRLRARLFELDNDTVAAEAGYRRALDVAEQQGAKLFSLRAAVDLSRLLQLQCRTLEAHSVLGPIYGWFTEGFEFPDLLRAKAALDAVD